MGDRVGGMGSSPKHPTEATCQIAGVTGIRLVQILPAPGCSSHWITGSDGGPQVVSIELGQVAIAFGSCLMEHDVCLDTVWRDVQSSQFCFSVFYFCKRNPSLLRLRALM